MLYLIFVYMDHAYKDTLVPPNVSVHVYQEKQECPVLQTYGIYVLAIILSFYKEMDSWTFI